MPRQEAAVECGGWWNAGKRHDLSRLEEKRGCEKSQRAREKERLVAVEGTLASIRRESRRCHEEEAGNQRFAGYVSKWGRW